MSRILSVGSFSIPSTASDFLKALPNPQGDLIEIHRDILKVPKRHCVCSASDCPAPPGSLAHPWPHKWLLSSIL